MFSRAEAAQKYAATLLLYFPAVCAIGSREAYARVRRKTTSVTTRRNRLEYISVICLSQRTLMLFSRFYFVYISLVNCIKFFGAYTKRYLVTGDKKSECVARTNLFINVFFSCCVIFKPMTLLKWRARRHDFNSSKGKVAASTFPCLFFFHRALPIINFCLS